MLIYLIKNNIKLMLRNKWIIVVMIAGPIIVIAALTSAFENMMKSYQGVDEFAVGYHLSEDSIFHEYIDVMKEAGKEAGLHFTEFPSGNAEEIMKKNDCLSFVDFMDDTYMVYTLDNYQAEGMTTEYFLNKLMTHIVYYEMLEKKETLNIPVIQLETMPNVEAKDYYGIAFTVYFIWCCFVALAPVLTSEKKFGIEKKFWVSPVSDFQLYLAKVIPCVLVTLCIMTITLITETILFELKWGNLFYVALVISFTVISATTLGLFLMYLFDNLAITIVVAFSCIWVAGYFGGCFETYMYSSHPEAVKILSPIYHTNRALVEYSSIGSSKYAVSSILYLAVMSIVFTLAGLVLAKIRKGRR